MTGVIAEDTAQHLRAALEKVLRNSPDSAAEASAAVERLVDVLETSAGAVVFPVDATVSTQQAAALLGVSRMTVVRLIERGELVAGAGAVHRRIAVSELALYQSNSSRRRRSALAELADEITADTPPDQVITTR